MTDSSQGKIILENWLEMLPKFIKITPFEFKRALEERKKANK